MCGGLPVRSWIEYQVKSITNNSTNPRLATYMLNSFSDPQVFIKIPQWKGSRKDKDRERSKDYKGFN